MLIERNAPAVFFKWIAFYTCLCILFVCFVLTRLPVYISLALNYFQTTRTHRWGAIFKQSSWRGRLYWKGWRPLVYILKLVVLPTFPRYVCWKQKGHVESKVTIHEGNHPMATMDVMQDSCTDLILGQKLIQRYKTVNVRVQCTWKGIFCKIKDSRCPSHPSTCKR